MLSPLATRKILKKGIVGRATEDDTIDALERLAELRNAGALGTSFGPRKRRIFFGED